VSAELPTRRSRGDSDEWGGVCLSERTLWRRLRLGDSRHRYRPRVSTSHGDLNLGGFGLAVEPGTDGVAALRSVAWSRLA